MISSNLLLSSAVISYRVSYVVVSDKNTYYHALLLLSIIYINKSDINKSDIFDFA